MQSLNDVELDLVWFFQRGEGDCGFSSSQGHFLDVAKLGAWSHGQSQDPLDAEWRVRRVALNRRVSQRLRMLSEHHQAVLGAAYSSPEAVRGVALSLLAGTPKAQQAHSRLTARGYTNTTREWILWLCTKALRSSSANTQLVEIIRQATELKREALLAYQKQTAKPESVAA